MGGRDAKVVEEPTGVSGGLIARIRVKGFGNGLSMNGAKGITQVDGQSNVGFVGVEMSANAMNGDFGSAMGTDGDLQGFELSSKGALFSVDGALCNEADEGVGRADGTNAA